MGRVHVWLLTFHEQRCDLGLWRDWPYGWSRSVVAYFDFGVPERLIGRQSTIQVGQHSALLGMAFNGHCPHPGQSGNVWLESSWSVRFDDLGWRTSLLDAVPPLC